MMTNTSAITENEEIPHAQKPHRIEVIAMSPDERSIVHQKCRHAEDAGMIESFNYYKDFARERTVFEIVFSR
jgi:hypothetical protein